MVRFEVAGFGAFDAARRIAPSRWDRFDLFHVREGAVRLQLGGNPVDLHAGTGVLIYPDTPFEGDALTPTCTVGVQHFTIDGNVRRTQLPHPLRRVCNCTCGYAAFQLTPEDGVARDIERLIEWHFAPFTEELHSMREALIVLVLGQIELKAVKTPSCAPPHALDRLAEWLAERCHCDISLAEMAEQARMSESHFRAEFRSRFGRAPGQYFRALRLSEAARQLRQTAVPIKSIASRLGFSNLPNFYRSFRSAYGLTPIVYRQRHALPK